MAITLSEWVQRLDAAARERLPGELRRVTIAGAMHAEGQARLNATKGGRSGLNVRTGLLRNSTTARAEFDARSGGVDSLIRIRANVPYASTHEYGATITPKAGRYLAIPLPAAKTAAGVSRGSPRMFPDLFFVISSRGNPLLARRDGDGIVPMFALKERVTVPRRPFVAPALEDTRKRLPAMIAGAFRRAVATDG